MRVNAAQDFPVDRTSPKPLAPADSAAHSQSQVRVIHSLGIFDPAPVTLAKIWMLTWARVCEAQPQDSKIFLCTALRAALCAVP
jgi:hypothetical protein